jgi:hypothetical protein
MDVTIVSVKAVKPKTAGDAWTGRVADHSSGEKASRAGYERARGRAKSAIEQPLPRARRCRCQ